MSTPINKAYEIVVLYKPVTICTDKEHTLYDNEKGQSFCPVCHPPF